jgi:arginyl-tRNA synthetase
MAHARMSGIFRVAGVDPESLGTIDLTALPAPEDAELAKLLPVFEETIARAARDLQPNRVTDYLEDLSRVTHAWYHAAACSASPRRWSEPAGPREATRTILANGLAVLGLSAPERI